MRTELVLRFDYGSAVPWVSRVDEWLLCGRSPAPTWSCLRTPSADARRGLADGRRLRRDRRARRSRSRSLTAPSHLPAPPPIDPDAALARTEAFWREWSGRCALAGPWSTALKRSLITLKALTYAPDRRHRRGADDLAAGADRRHPQLGLPLLLAARRDADPAGPDQRRLRRRGARLARLAAARRRRQPGPDADHVRPRRRAAADRMGGAVAARLRGLPAGADRQCRRTASCSSTSIGEVMDCAAPGPSRRAWRRTRPAGPCSARCSTISTPSGASPTRASGRCAARGATSPTPR